MEWKDWARRGILLVCIVSTTLASSLTITGGAICGTFIVFGGLSVLLYKPWRRRIDKKRLGNAHFEPLSQGPLAAQELEEEVEDRPVSDQAQSKDVNVDVVPVEITAHAGPAYRQHTL